MKKTKMNKANELTINRTLTIPAKGKHCHGNSKAVLLVEEGNVYFSMADVAETMEVSRPAISQAIQDEYKVKGKTPILVAELPSKTNLLCEAIQSLNQRNSALEADSKGMEAEINQLRDVIKSLTQRNHALEADAKGMEEEINRLLAELAKARDIIRQYAEREAKRQEAAELRRKLALLEKELEVNIA